jgi:hypothetical protein
MIPGSHLSSIAVRASLRAGSSPRRRWLLVRAARLPRFTAGYGSKRQPGRPLALLAALVLIAALTPPMASAATTLEADKNGHFEKTKKVDNIRHELLGANDADLSNKLAHTELTGTKEEAAWILFGFDATGGKLTAPQKWDTLIEWHGLSPYSISIL